MVVLLTQMNCPQHQAVLAQSVGSSYSTSLVLANIVAGKIRLKYQ